DGDRVAGGGDGGEEVDLHGPQPPGQVHDEGPDAGEVGDAGAHGVDGRPQDRGTVAGADGTGGGPHGPGDADGGGGHPTGGGDGVEPGVVEVGQLGDGLLEGPLGCGAGGGVGERAVLDPAQGRPQ